MISFQLTRSAGSVTQRFKIHRGVIVISTHTLRGERDFTTKEKAEEAIDFNSHAPLGARLKIGHHDEQYPRFQLTRSAGSVTKSAHHRLDSLDISTHTLRGERDAILPTG